MTSKLALCAMVTIALAAGSAWATSDNYDPLAPAPAPILGAGWTSDAINAAYTNSADSPYVYNLAAPAVFRITDQFVTGDTYYVYDFGSLILTTSLTGAMPSISPIGDSYGDSGWTSASYSHGEITLGAGAHSLTVQGDGAGGLPAGFYTRLDAAPVPEPVTMFSAFLAISGLGAYIRKRARA